MNVEQSTALSNGDQVCVGSLWFSVRHLTPLNTKTSGRVYNVGASLGKLFILFNFSTTKLQAKFYTKKNSTVTSIGDICLLPHSFEEMLRKLSKLAERAASVGLFININKIKSMRICTQQY